MDQIVEQKLFITSFHHCDFQDCGKCPDQDTFPATEGKKFYSFLILSARA